MNDLVKTNVQLPAHLANRLGTGSAITQSMAAGGGSSFPRISIRGGRFRIREGKEEKVLGTTLHAVIVGANTNTTKLFFKGAYDPKAEDVKPDCYSNDGVRPAEDAEDPQAQLCATCDQNQWGSKLTESGGKMKACADQKRLAIISADDKSQEPVVYAFTVPPSSLGNFRNYGKMLDAKGFPAELCITKITFDEETSHPKPQFEHAGFVSEDMLPIIDELVASAHVKEVTGETPIKLTSTAVPTPAKLPPKVEKVEKVEAIEGEVISPPKKQGGFQSGFQGEVIDVESTPVETPKPKAEPEAKAVQSSQVASDIQDILNKMKADDDE